jgi:transcriptional regulator with XRE-family HTH domain
MNKKTIGGFIAALRKARGMTQQEVADRLNVSNKTISKWERDDGYPEITIIPALAELFEVTGDEILRGERIPPAERDPEKQAARVVKQIRRIVNSSATRFQNYSYLAAALSLSGWVLLLTVTYTFYRPVLGFGIMALLVIASVTMECYLLNTVRAAVKDHELTGEHGPLLAPLWKTVNRHTFAVFMINFTVLLLSLPFVLFRDSYYLDSVISTASYLASLKLLLPLAALIGALAVHLFQEKLFIKKRALPGDYPRKEMLLMTLLQGGALLLAVAFGIADVLIGYDGGAPVILFIVGFCVLAGCAILFMIALVVKSKTRTARLLLLAAGIRNILYALAVIGTTSWLSVSRNAEGESFYQVYFSAGPLLLLLGATIAYLLVRNYLLHRNNRNEAPGARENR